MTPAVKLLEKNKIRFVVREYQVADNAKNYGEAAAMALEQDTAQVYKTLVSIIDGNQRKPVISLVAVADQLDLKKLAAQMSGRKAVMAEPALAQRVTGYLVGGISPLGQRQLLPTLIDKSAKSFNTIFVSGGRRGLQLELNPEDLVELLEAQYGDIAKNFPA